MELNLDRQPQSKIEFDTLEHLAQYTAYTHNRRRSGKLEKRNPGESVPGILFLQIAGVAPTAIGGI